MIFSNRNLQISSIEKFTIYQDYFLLTEEERGNCLDERKSDNFCEYWSPNLMIFFDICDWGCRRCWGGGGSNDYRVGGSIFFTVSTTLGD